MPPATRRRPAAKKAPVVISEDGELLDEGTVDTVDEDEDEPDIEDAEIPEALVFTSDVEAKTARDEDLGTVFEFDGRRFRAFKPKDTVMVTLVAANSSSATVADQVDAVLKWLDHCLEPVAKMHLQSRLYDRDDPIEWDDLANVMLGLLAHWDAPVGRAERRRKQKELRAKSDAANAPAGARGRYGARKR